MPACYMICVQNLAELELQWSSLVDLGDLIDPERLIVRTADESVCLPANAGDS